MYRTHLFYAYYRNTGTSTQCHIRVLIGSRYRKDGKVLPRYARDSRNVPKVHRGPQIYRGPREKLQSITRFHFKLLPFPVNLGPTRAYDSAIGGNASTGLGSADQHSLRDMKSMEADDRPTEDTNRKSVFLATKTLHRPIVPYVGVQANRWCTSSRARKVAISLILGALTIEVINVVFHHLAF